MNTFTFCSNESLAFWVGVQIPFRLSLRTDFHPGQSYFRSMTGPLSWCSTLAALCRHMLFRYKMLLVCAYVRVHGCMCLYLQVYMCVYMCTSESRRQPLVQFLRSNPSFFVRRVSYWPETCQVCYTCLWDPGICRFYLLRSGIPSLCYVRF